MDRAQRVDEKNGVICLVITFNFRFMVIKMWKMAHFLLKKLVTVWVKYLSATEKPYRVLSENGMVTRLSGYRSWDIEDGKKSAESARNTKTLYMQVLTSC